MLLSAEKQRHALIQSEGQGTIPRIVSRKCQGEKQFGKHLSQFTLVLKVLVRLSQAKKMSVHSKGGGVESITPFQNPQQTSALSILNQSVSMRFKHISKTILRFYLILYPAPRSK